MAGPPQMTTLARKNPQHTQQEEPQREVAPAPNVLTNTVPFSLSYSLLPSHRNLDAVSYLPLQDSNILMGFLHIRS